MPRPTSDYCKECRSALREIKKCSTCHEPGTLGSLLTGDKACKVCTWARQKLAACEICSDTPPRPEAETPSGFGFTIEKGIPLPPGGSARFGVFVEAFSKMEVGDSFLVARKERPSIGHVSAKFPDRDFTCKQVDGGFRIWRIK